MMQRDEPANTNTFVFVPTPDSWSEWISRQEPPSERGDAGVDILMPKTTTLPPLSVTKVNLGIRAVYMEAGTPRGYMLVPRSSIAKTPLMMANSIGIIDSGYRGPLIVAVRNCSQLPYQITKGDALFQVVRPDLHPVGQVYLEQNDPMVDELFGEGRTVRGAGGFGSTGSSGSNKHIRLNETSELFIGSRSRAS